MLAAKKSAGVTPEVNLRNMLPADSNAYTPGNPTRVEVNRSQKWGYQVPHKKDYFEKVKAKISFGGCHSLYLIFFASLIFSLSLPVHIM